MIPGFRRYLGLSLCLLPVSCSYDSFPKKETPQALLAGASFLRGVTQSAAAVTVASVSVLDRAVCCSVTDYVTIFEYYFIYLSYFLFWLTLYLLSYKLWSMLKIFEPSWVLTNCFVINSRSMYIIIVPITKSNNVKVVGEFVFDFVNNSN